MAGFPIDKLYQAYNVLEGQGNEAFRRFVNREGMPNQDIERVLSKYAYIHNPEYKVQIDEIKKEFYRRFKKIG